MVIAKIAVTMSLVLTLFLACAIPNQVDPQIDTNDRLSAEYSQIKKRIPMLERENDVLKEENQAYRQKVRNLEVGFDQITSNLARLSKQVQQSREADDAAIQALRGRMDRQDGKIETREQRHKVSTKKLKSRIQDLDKQIAGQASEFGKRLEGNAKKQSDLDSRIAQLQQSLAARKVESEALTKTLSEFAAKLDAAATQIEEINRSHEKQLSEHEALKASEAELRRQLKTLSDQFDQKIAELKRALLQVNQKSE